ncbi:PREDICTED: glycine-rich cell wall structural protein 1.8-like [Priapulus caudatus]|uniref:Glycine-rich cell wall structural protein 1.8-like n=1 Tax=Priapulus caudatus TaxID=37621 RepID=A0ABM1E7N5_PRICU|nr:PREDICTED: glycine-rich cell wall structural protein 1.8-like [Priapulus caudatus]
MACASGYFQPGYGRARRHGGAYDATGGHSIGSISDAGSYSRGAAFGAGGTGAYSRKGHSYGHGHEDGYGNRWGDGHANGYKEGQGNEHGDQSGHGHGINWGYADGNGHGVHDGQHYDHSRGNLWRHGSKSVGDRSGSLGNIGNFVNDLGTIGSIGHLGNIDEYAGGGSGIHNSYRY